MRRALTLLATLLATGLGAGCGITIDIQSTPNPAEVGRPVEIEMTVTNDEPTCTVESIQLCLFPFAELTAKQQETLTQIESARAEGHQGELSVSELPAGFPCDLGVALAPLEAMALPANGVTCSQPDGNAPIACDVGSLGPGESTTFTVLVTPSEAGMFSHLVDATGNLTGSQECSGVAMDMESEEIEVLGSRHPAPVLSHTGFAILAVVLLQIGFIAVARRRRA